MGWVVAIILTALIAKAASGSKPAPTPKPIDDSKTFDPKGPEKDYTLPTPPIAPPVEPGEVPYVGPFCSSYAIGSTHGLIAKERDLINSKYGGLGSAPIDVNLALKELSRAHELVRLAGK